MSETGEKKDKNDLKLIGFAVFAVLLASIPAAWNWVDLQKKPLEGTKRQFDASLDFVKTIATIAGGVVLYLNFRVANRSAELAQKKLEQETDKAKADAKLAEARLTMERFSKAVDMMGSDKSIHLRLGGIYALESIALDSSDDKIDENYRQVLEVLTAFVRENAKLKLEKESTIPSQPLEQPTVETGEQQEEIPPLPIDIQAALTVLSRRKHKDTDWKQYPLDLHKTDLRRAFFAKVHLQKANLRAANLQKADLSEANLQETDLLRANFQRANLQEANFQRANLQEVNFQNATLFGANLPETHLSWANLQEATLCGANFQKAFISSANLCGASLQNTNFREANLQVADLRGANLQNSDLRGANLREADFSWANLQKARLRGANLQSANLSEANLKDVILLCANLRNIENLTLQQLDGEHSPLLCNVALPEGCTVNPNRDCDRLPQELVKRYPDQFPSLEEAKSYVDEQRQKKWE